MHHFDAEAGVSHFKKKKWLMFLASHHENVAKSINLQFATGAKPPASVLCFPCHRIQRIIEQAML
jgi:hypothetical protein